MIMLMCMNAAMLLLFALGCYADPGLWIPLKPVVSTEEALSKYLLDRHGQGRRGHCCLPWTLQVRTPVCVSSRPLWLCFSSHWLCSSRWLNVEITPCSAPATQGKYNVLFCLWQLLSFWEGAIVPLPSGLEFLFQSWDMNIFWEINEPRRLQYKGAWVA